MKLTESTINELLLKFCEDWKIEHIQVETLVQPMPEVYIAKIDTSQYDHDNIPFQETNLVNYLDDFLQKELYKDYVTCVEYTSNDQLLIMFIG